jgi:hypothetical protein
MEPSSPSASPGPKKSKKSLEQPDESLPGGSASPATPTKVKKKKIKSATSNAGGTGEEGVIDGKEAGFPEKAKIVSTTSTEDRAVSEEVEKIGVTIVRSKSKSKMKESRSGVLDSEKREKRMEQSSSKGDLTGAGGASSSSGEVPGSANTSPRKEAMAEQVRSNLMSPLTRVRQTTGRSRAGSSPARRESAAQIRAQVQAETERLAKAGNVTAKRILHRAKSESEVSMNSWDLGSTAGLRVNFVTNDELLARAHAAATKRTNAPLLQTRQSVLRLPDSFSPSFSKDIVAEQLLAPMRARNESNSHGPRKNQTLRAGSSSLTEDLSSHHSTSASSMGSEEASSPATTPRSPRNASKRSLASFGRKTSYHSLGRTSSGMLPSLLSPAGSPRTATPPIVGNDPSTGDKAKSHMEAFLRFVSSHLSNPLLAEGIALMHSVLVPSTFLFDHLQALFKADSETLGESVDDPAALRKDIVNFIGTWVTIGTTDFVDDFVLEKKLKDWITGLMDSSDQTFIGFSLLLQNIFNQAAQAHEALVGRVLSDVEIVDMAEALKRGQSPGDVISLIPSVPVLRFPPLRASSAEDVSSSESSSSKPAKRYTSRGMVKSPSYDSANSSERASTPSPPPFMEPSFENMVDLARRVSSREVRSEMSATHLAVPSGAGSASSSPTPSPGRSKPAADSTLVRKESRSSTKTKTDEVPRLQRSPSSLFGSSNNKSDKEKDKTSSAGVQGSGRDPSLSSSHGVYADADELSRKPRIGKKLLSHLSEQIGLKEVPLLLNISVEELAKQWTLLDHQMICRIRSHDLLLNVSKPSRSHILTDIANKFNHATCWVAVQILKIPNVKKRALAVAHMIALAEILLNLTNLHGFIAIITGLSQHAISRLNLTWKKVDPSAKRTFDALVNLASPIGNFKQLRSLHDNALPPFVPTPAMFLRDLLFVIDGNGGSFVQASVIKTDMILLSRKVLSRIQCAQQLSYKFWGFEAIQSFLASGSCLTNEELDSLSEKVESGRDL